MLLAEGVVLETAPVVAEPGLSKYLSNAALAFPGGPNGVALLFSPLSLLADLALWMILLAVDSLLEVETLLDWDS